MAGAAFGLQVAVLVGIALLITLGVYGLVAGIAKLDDAGLWLMKLLAVLGTAAMFLGGGGIIVHGFPWLGALVHGAEHELGLIPGVGDVLADFTVIMLNGLVGMLTVALLLAAVALGRIARKAQQRQSAE